MTAEASALAVAFAWLCAVLAGATFDGAPSQRVTLRTDDGLTLSAQWYEPVLATRSGGHPRPHAQPLAARLGGVRAPAGR